VKLQICFSPSRFIDLKAGKWKSAREEIAFARSLGASYINLWVWQSVLFYDHYGFDSDFDRFNPTAEAFYRDCIVECRRRNLGIIGKLGNWNLPHWISAEPGIVDIDSPAYPAQLKIHQRFARTLNRELQLDGWMVGNEPQIEGTKYGWHPSDPRAEYHTPEDCIQIAIDKTRAVAPELDGIRIGYAMEGIGSLKIPFISAYQATERYWEATSDLLDYAGINAYPTSTYRAPTESNYARKYDDLCEIAPLWPSEQGIAREWTQSSQQRWNWVESLIAHTPTWSNIFSKFRLTANQSTGDNWGLLRRDGSVDGVADLLRETFYRREKFHAVK
jgi:hypothetical protein